MLTPTQIGDMIVNSDTLTRMDLAAQLIQFFRQSKSEDVQIVLKQFTKAASMVDFVCLFFDICLAAVIFHPDLLRTGGDSLANTKSL